MNQPAKPRRRLWKWLGGLFMLAIACIGVFLFVTWRMTQTIPDYWQVIDAADPNVEQTGSQFEQSLTKELTKIREPNEPWSLQVNQQQMHAWLATRGPMWLRNRGVDQGLLNMIGNPMVAFRGGRIEAAAMVRFKDIEQLVRAVYKPQLADGRVRLVLEGVYAGSMPLPADALSEQLGPQLERINPEFRARAAEMQRLMQSIDLALPLGDGRTVDVTDITVHDGGAELTCVTRLPQAAAK